MTFLNALSLAQWSLLAFVFAAIISLYFLKLRRKPLEISSTLLWQKTVEDIHVNSIWQKIRNNLLLWLQLLILAIIALACLRPGWQGTKAIGQRAILMVDNSASMQALDSGITRLEQAKEQARLFVSEMKNDDIVMVLSFSDRVEVRQGFTSDKNKLVDAINRIESTNRVSDISGLMATVDGLAASGRAGEGASAGASQEASEGMQSVESSGSPNGSGNESENEGSQVPSATPRLKTTAVLLSDGGFGAITDEGLEHLNLSYSSVGTVHADNLAITSFSVQRNESNQESLEAFARVANFTNAEVKTTVSLDVDGTLLDATEVTVPANQETTVLFGLQQVQTGVLKISLDRDDDLLLDNTAYAAVQPASNLSVVLITPGNKTLELALQTERFRKLANVRIEDPDFLTTADYAKIAAGEEGELIIYDRSSPRTLPNASTLFIGAYPPGTLVAQSNPPADPSSTPELSSTVEADTEGSTQLAGSGSVDSLRAEWSVGPVVGPLYVIDVDRAHPTTRLLEMSSVAILAGRSVEPPTGGSVLMLGNQGPLFAVAPRGSFVDAVLGFGMIAEDGSNTINTDWGTKRSFPVFIYSAVEYLVGGMRSTSAKSVQPGKPVSLSLPQTLSRFQIDDLQSGRSLEVARSGESLTTLTQTDSLGSYAIRRPGSDKAEEAIEYFCVNLFSSRESNLAVQESVRLGDQDLADMGQQAQGRVETWRWIILLGLGIVFAEWLIFSRRVFG